MAIIEFWNYNKKFEVYSLEADKTTLSFFCARNNTARVFVKRGKDDMAEYTIFQPTFNGKQYAFLQVYGCKKGETILKSESELNPSREGIIREMLETIFSRFLSETDQIEIVKKELLHYVR